MATDLQWEMPSGSRITTCESPLVPAEVGGQVPGVIMKRNEEACSVTVAAAAQV